MGKKAYMLLIFSMLCYVNAGAGERLRFTWGLDWGICANAYFQEHNVFYSEEQSLVETDRAGWRYHTNGHIFGQVGVDIAQKVNLSLYSGYMGLGRGMRAIPLAARATYYFRSAPVSGPFVSLAGGWAFDEKWKQKSGYTGQAGLGYRWAVGSGLMMDLSAGVRLSQYHPREFVDFFTGSLVSGERYVSARSFVGGLYLSLALHL